MTLNNNPTREVTDLMIVALPKPFTSTGPPPEVLADMLKHWMTYQTHLYVLKQYENRIVEPIITFDKVAWEIVGKPEEAKAYVVDHACEECRDAKSTAELWLADNPGQNLAFVSVRYTESWPIGTSQLMSSKPVHQ